MHFLKIRMHYFHAAKFALQLTNKIMFYNEQIVKEQTVQMLYNKSEIP